MDYHEPLFFRFYDATDPERALYVVKCGYRKPPQGLGPGWEILRFFDNLAFDEYRFKHYGEHTLTDKVVTCQPRTALFSDPDERGLSFAVWINSEYVGAEYIFGPQYEDIESKGYSTVIRLPHRDSGEWK